MLSRRQSLGDAQWDIQKMLLSKAETKAGHINNTLTPDGQWFCDVYFLMHA
jgi:hypothetical protein